MAERPVECSQCKRAIHCIYKEITQDSTLVTEMCLECPVLERKLHGGAVEGAPSKGRAEQKAGVYCGSCDTNLEWIKMGNPLGCMECYDVFSDVILADLIKTAQIPSRLKKSIEMKSHLPLHIGRPPKELTGIAPSEQITSLSEALKEALRRENYEQAAWLRDQIKALEEKKADGK